MGGFLHPWVLVLSGVFSLQRSDPPSFVGTGNRGQRLFLNVTHLNEAENQEFHKRGQMYVNDNPCSLGYPWFHGEAGGKSPNFNGVQQTKTVGRVAKSCSSQCRQLLSPLFLPYFTWVLNCRPVIEYCCFVPIDSRLGVEHFCAAHHCFEYLANC